MTGSNWNDGPDEQAAPYGQELQPAQPGLSPPAGQPAGGWPGPAGSDTVEFSAGATTPGPRRTRRVVIATAAVVAVVAVAAVVLATQAGSSSPGHTTPAQVLADAAHNAGTLKSLSATYSEQIGGVTGGSVNGSIKEVRKPLQMSMSMTESLGGQVIPISAIVTGTNMYMKFAGIPGMPKAIAGKWIEFPLTGKSLGSLGSLLQSVENENPASQTQLLLASKNLRADGTQVLDGVNTTRYVGYFTPSQALKELPASQRAVLGPALKALTGNINFTVWIDGSHQIRKFVEIENVSSETVKVTFTFLSFNQPVTITIPPANQIMRMPASGLNGI